MKKQRVGIVGYGHLGEYLARGVLERSGTMELAFVWNRSSDKIEADPLVAPFLLKDLDSFHERHADLIVEVAHPLIVEQYVLKFLQHANVMVGSPTAFANKELETNVRKALSSSPYGLYVPVGAFWGADDVFKMAERGSLKGLKVVMKKHPSCFKLHDTLQALNENAYHSSSPIVLYSGSVRELCPLAPNNVNTMAIGALAGYTLGFDNVLCELVADISLKCHVVQIDVTGPSFSEGSPPFTVSSTRINPSQDGVVTGNATYASFLSSLVRAHGLGPGMHFV